MKISATGLALLSNEEGLRLSPYNDSAGHATVGVGHLIHHGPVTTRDIAKYRGFTRPDAIRLLRSDVASREVAVNELVRVDLAQNEFDALVSLVFNIGAGEKGFAGSTVRRKLNSGDRRGAADAFLMWRIGGPGLINRRKRERSLFLARPKDPLKPLTRVEREHANKLLWHRRSYRREARSSKGPKFQAHKKHAANYRKWLEERIEQLEQQDPKQFKRARRIGILKRVLVATDGRYVELPAATLRQVQRKMDPLSGLSRPEREHADRLLWHRRSYRREARSSKGPKFQAHKKHAANYRKWLEERIQRLGRQDITQFNRARRIDILKRVVKATDGNL